MIGRAVASGDAAAPAPRQRFLRDAGLPFIEAREVQGALDASYARHAHETFSVGAVTGGRSDYLHERGVDEVEAGTVVLMNPEAMHACNPHRGTPWSYRMIHVDANWLAGVQAELGVGDGRGMRGFAARTSRDPALVAAVAHVCRRLADPFAGTLGRHEAAVELCTALHERLGDRVAGGPGAAPAALALVEDYLRAHSDRPVALAELVEASGLSASHLVRAFKARYGLPPHAWLLNHRIQRSRAALRDGRPIAEVAQAFGFADQAHLQRAFKRLVAATPGEYRRG